MSSALPPWIRPDFCTELRMDLSTKLRNRDSNSSATFLISCRSPSPLSWSTLASPRAMSACIRLSVKLESIDVMDRLLASLKESQLGFQRARGMNGLQDANQVGRLHTQRIHRLDQIADGGDRDD